MARDMTAADGRGGAAWRLAGWGVATGAAVLLVVVNGAVGFLGDEDNPANAILLGVPATALLGAALARFRSAGMVRAMRATAAAQAVIGGLALAAGLGSPGWHGVYEVALGTTLFGALWLLSAWSFESAARAA